jgi:hypothetical protein
MAIARAFDDVLTPRRSPCETSAGAKRDESNEEGLVTASAATGVSTGRIGDFEAARCLFHGSDAVSVPPICWFRLAARLNWIGRFAARGFLRAGGVEMSQPGPG